MTTLFGLRSLWVTENNSTRRRSSDRTPSSGGPVTVDVVVDDEGATEVTTTVLAGTSAAVVVVVSFGVVVTAGVSSLSDSIDAGPAHPKAQTHELPHITDTVTRRRKEFIISG
jgi:hypothetical protein